MTSDTSGLVDRLDEAARLGRGGRLQSTRILSAGIAEAATEIRRLTALLERRTEALRMFVDAAKPRRQDGYHEMPMFSARELEIARASLKEPAD